VGREVRRDDLEKVGRDYGERFEREGGREIGRAVGQGLIMSIR
jgi:hypothetical protein